ncbi:hypothetical protein WMY93_031707 [Mugilogobius chulae]|uniref:LINE-1 type transposase domain-containing 1 n=1 Tax=Mugilogobius chulae TaxID=88201 RepID=A0AAW0ME29_9GOBI
MSNTQQKNIGATTTRAAHGAAAATYTHSTRADARQDEAPQSTGEDCFSMSLLMAELAKHQASTADLIRESMKPLQASVDALHESVNAFQTRLVQVEVRVGENFEKLTEAETRIKALEKQNDSLLNRLEDLENRSRRVNLRIINIPEKSEYGKDNTVFISELLKDALGPDVFPSPPYLERAHRTGPVGSSPRPFLVCFHRYQEKEKVLRWCRQHKLEFEGHVLRAYPDLSTALARKRAEFKPIKALLYEKGVQFRLLYPAQLKIVYNGESHTFKSSKDATDFFNQHIATG